MINQQIFKEILAKFKSEFPGKHWNAEKFKWKAVKHFQNHWDINAPDFLNMFLKSTERTEGLLGSMHNFPRDMMRNFISAAPEEVRAMFTKLFDETKDVSQRIISFISDSELLRQKYNDGTWTQHYQNTNSVSTYLWLRYPDKYYIYKYSECRAVAKKLESDYMPTKGNSLQNINSFMSFYNEICLLLKKDGEIGDILKSCITDDCYSDTELKTLTIDFGFYISRYLSGSSSKADQLQVII